MNVTDSTPISQVALPVSLAERALPDPFVGTGVLSGGLAGANQAEGSIWYHMRISGPSAEVPVIFYGDFQSTAQTYDELDMLSVANSESLLTLYNPDGSRHTMISEHFCTSYRRHLFGPSCGFGYFSVPVSLMTDTLYGVQLYASVSAEIVSRVVV